MSQEFLIKAHLAQNHPDFKLKPLDEQPFFLKEAIYKRY
jgi:hypothetical protein